MCVEIVQILYLITSLELKLCATLGTTEYRKTRCRDRIHAPLALWRGIESSVYIYEANSTVVLDVLEILSRFTPYLHLP